jgi:hypothetical protein
MPLRNPIHSAMKFIWTFVILFSMASGLQAAYVKVDNPTDKEAWFIITYQQVDACLYDPQLFKVPAHTNGGFATKKDDFRFDCYVTRVQFVPWDPKFIWWAPFGHYDMAKPVQLLNDTDIYYIARPQGRNGSNFIAYFRIEQDKDGNTKAVKLASDHLK